MKRLVFSIMVVVLLLSSCGSGLKVLSGDVVSIDTPVDDDVIAAGNSVYLNAPVDSLTVMAGTVGVNAPVKGDLIVAGGLVQANSEIGGKAVIGAVTFNLNGAVQKNLVALAGQVNMHKGAVVGKDAFIAANQVYSDGLVNGTLNVTASSFSGNGTANKTEFTRIETESKPVERKEAYSFFDGLMAFGFLIAGLILLLLLPSLFKAMDDEVRTSIAWKILVGFIAIISVFAVSIVLLITIVGIPLAILLIMFLGLAITLAHMFVSFGLGRALLLKVKDEPSSLLAFVVGYVLLNILFLVPFLGGIVRLFAACLGFGAILYGMKRWHKI